MGLLLLSTQFLRAKKPKVNQLRVEQTQHQFPVPATTDANVPNIKNEVVLLANNGRWLIPEADEGPGLNSAAPRNISADGEDHS